MLKQRIITACILVLVLVAVLWLLPPLGFQVFIAAILGLAAWEWSRLAGLEAAAGRSAYVVIFMALLAALTRLSPDGRMFLLATSLLWWLVALVLVCNYPRLSSIWNNRLLALLAGFLVLFPGWIGMLYLRALESYVGFILFFFALVAAADMGAYFAGRRFGRRKLAPAVSPNKTWEGFAGGQLAACAVLWSVLFAGGFVGEGGFAFGAKATLGMLLVAASSVVGDLFESMLKRHVKVKDSGALLPGHGGVLDRIDSVTAALPVFTLVLLFAELLQP